ncbi:MAG TPA: mechanosensitive ion channel family protein [Melioribacteraceae bacterium]|nr:mechanosensitive ion channel family protein [Melioribacteraceae bacterium]
MKRLLPYVIFFSFNLVLFSQVNNNTYPVVLDNDTLFTVSKGLGSLNPNKRAEQISHNLTHLLDIAADYNSIVLVDDGIFVSIAYKDFIILSVSPLDTIDTGSNMHLLAEGYKNKIKIAIKKTSEKYSIRNTLLSMVKFAGVIIIAFSFFWLIKITFRKIYKFINSTKFNYTLKIKDKTILDPDIISGSVLIIFRLIRLVVSLIVLFYFITISLSLFAYTKNFDIKVYLKSIFYIVFAFALYISLIKLINSFFNLMKGKIDEWKTSIVKSVNIKNIQFFSEERLVEITALSERVLRIGFIFITTYLFVAFVFSNFEYTSGWTDKLLFYLWNPVQNLINAFINYLPNIFTITVIVVFIHYINKLLKFIFDEIGKKTITFTGFLPEWSEPTYKIARFLFIVFGAIVIFPYLPGSNSPVFQGFSVFLGILFSLGSSSAISNIVAGVVITYMNPFKIGDRVKIAETTGDIIEKSLLVTRIRTTKNVNITIPNSMILGSHIVNYSASIEKGLILHTTVTIGYDVPWEKVHKLLIDAALETPDILTNPNPFVLQTGLEDFYVSYEINAYTQKPNQMAKIYSDLYKNIQNKFNEAEVEIMSPHYSAVRDGNKTTIPDDYLPKDYKTPGFNITNFLDNFNK